MNIAARPHREIVLRDACADDADALAALMTPEISRWLSVWPELPTCAQAEAIIAAARSGDARARPFVVLVDGRVAGWLKIMAWRDGEKSVEIGYWLGGDFHGQGVALPMVTRALAIAFNDLGADRVYAGAQIENAASLGLLRRCGFSFSHERMDYAPARQREEPCLFLELSRETWHAGRA